MKNLVTIEGAKLERIEFNGQAVISLPMVDKVHKLTEGNARRAFNRNKHRFLAGEDYFNLPYEDWSILSGTNCPAQIGKRPTQMVGTNCPDQRPQRPDQKGHKGNMTFLTLSGYMMLAKTFTDDLSWKIQRMLVKSYFEATKTVSDLKDDIIALQGQLIDALRRKTGPIKSEEQRSFKEAIRAGLTVPEIAKKFGRGLTSIRKYTREERLGRRTEQLVLPF